MKLDQPLCQELPPGLFSAPSFAKDIDKEVKDKPQLKRNAIQTVLESSFVLWFSIQKKVKLWLPTTPVYGICLYECV